MAALDTFAQLIADASSVVTPLGPCPLAQLVDERAGSCDRAHRQERRRHIEVVTGQGEGLVNRAYRMADLEATIPDRIPQRRREVIDIAFVQQQQIEIAVRAEVAAPITAGRDKGRSVITGGKVGPQDLQPTVDPSGVGLAPPTALQGRLA